MNRVGKFFGAVTVEQDGPYWVLVKAIAYVEYEDSKPVLDIVVPTGFVTDFATIPRVFWSLAWPTEPEYSEASIVHDRLYETHELSKRDADAVFFRAMGISGTPLWKRRLMWAAVRVFGGAAYASGPLRKRQRLVVDRRRSMTLVKS